MHTAFKACHHDAEASKTPKTSQGWPISMNPCGSPTPIGLYARRPNTPCVVQFRVLGFEQLIIRCLAENPGTNTGSGGKSSVWAFKPEKRSSLKGDVHVRVRLIAHPYTDRWMSNWT
jgi:hypothetical protein